MGHNNPSLLPQQTNRLFSYRWWQSYRGDPLYRRPPLRVVKKKAKRENERRGLLREKAMDFRRKTTRLIFKLVRPSTEQRVTIQSHGCASRLVQLCGYLVVGASLFTSTTEWPSMRDRKSYASPTATMATTDINFDFNLFNKIKSISGRVFQETTMFAPWRRQNTLHLSSRSKQKEKNLFPTYFLAYSGVCGM